MRAADVLLLSSIMSELAQPVVHVWCVWCGRAGEIRDPALVARLRRRWRPSRFRCSSCGRATEGQAAELAIGVDTGVSPYRQSEALEE
ncbi:MAG: hypothetical protein AAFQ73_07930 [Pseudomonadota bacterium]